jgi:hypothetical protein
VRLRHSTRRGANFSAFRASIVSAMALRLMGCEAMDGDKARPEADRCRVTARAIIDSPRDTAGPAIIIEVTSFVLFREESQSYDVLNNTLLARAILVSCDRRMAARSTCSLSSRMRGSISCNLCVTRPWL